VPCKWTCSLRLPVSSAMLLFLPFCAFYCLTMQSLHNFYLQTRISLAVQIFKSLEGKYSFPEQRQSWRVSLKNKSIHLKEHASQRYTTARLYEWKSCCLLSFWIHFAEYRTIERPCERNAEMQVKNLIPH